MMWIVLVKLREFGVRTREAIAMALVKNIKRITQDSRVHAEVDCKYTTFNHAGENYLVLSTYGFQ